MRSAGPMSDLSIQAWSAVWRIPTSRGSVVLKQTTPGKAAEIAVYAFCAAVAPDYVDKPLSYDLGEARMLLADGGPTLHDTQQDTRDTVANAVIDYACFQQATFGHDARAKSTAIPAWNPADAAGEAEWQAQTLYSMPRTDLRHITSDQRDTLLNRRDALRAAGDLLDASTIPRCLDHGDLWPGNVLLPTKSGHYRFIDYDDAAWTHPFLSMMPLLRHCHQRWAPACASFDIDHPDLQYVSSAYLQQWTDYASPNELEGAFAAAAQLAPLRRSRAAITSFHHAGAGDEHDLGPTPWAWLNLMYSGD